MRPMDDVGRLFQHLVEVLAAREPGLLQAPISVADLYQKILPYRIHRVALGFDSNQDYEMALLQLLAGERGLVETDPPEARERLASEVRSANPNPSAFHAYGEAMVRLNFGAVKGVLEAEQAYAPPATEVPQRQRWQKAPQRPLPFELEIGSRPPAPTTCPHCDQTLPAARAVVFCPFCGGNVNVRPCPQCGTELEAAWRHCITCGYRAQ